MNLNATMLVQAIVFALFIWVTVKFVWPIILRPMEARQKNIVEGLAEAERGRASLLEAKKQSDTIHTESGSAEKASRAPAESPFTSVM